MPTSRVSGMTLNVGGVGAKVSQPQAKDAKAMTAALQTASGFADFKANPRSFAARFNVAIDATLSNKIKSSLRGIDSLKAARTKLGTNPRAATAWAVAVGAYSIASSKIAIAF